MSIETAYICDVCGEQRKEANHWFVAGVTNVGIHLHTWAWAVREEQLDEKGTKHLCGQKCAHRLLDEFLGSQDGALNRTQPTGEEPKTQA